MKKTLLFLLFATAVNYAQSQCLTPVTHDSGQMAYNGVSVTISTEGVASFFTNEFCEGNISQADYWIGYGNGPEDSGSFIFEFSPAVSAVTLDFQGIDNSDEDNWHEEVQVFVNGSHYAIPNAGTIQDCNDPLATLTPEGNIAGNRGWKGTTITGPITSLKVFDNILDGSPGGSVFNLYICNAALQTADIEKKISDLRLVTNPAATELFASSSKIFENGTMELYDPYGRKIKSQRFKGNSLTVAIDDLQSGVYALSVLENGEFLNSKKFVRP